MAAKKPKSDNNGLMLFLTDALINDLRHYMFYPLAEELGLLKFVRNKMILVSSVNHFHPLTAPALSIFDEYNQDEDFSFSIKAPDYDPVIVATIYADDILRNLRRHYNPKVTDIDMERLGMIIVRRFRNLILGAVEQLDQYKPEWVTYEEREAVKKGRKDGRALWSNELNSVFEQVIYKFNKRYLTGLYEPDEPWIKKQKKKGVDFINDGLLEWDLQSDSEAEDMVYDCFLPQILMHEMLHDICSWIAPKIKEHYRMGFLLPMMLTFETPFKRCPDYIWDEFITRVVYNPIPEDHETYEKDFPTLGIFKRCLLYHDPNADYEDNRLSYTDLLNEPNALIGLSISTITTMWKKYYDNKSDEQRDAAFQDVAIEIALLLLHEIKHYIQWIDPDSTEKNARDAIRMVVDDFKMYPEKICDNVREFQIDSFLSSLIEKQFDVFDAHYRSEMKYNAGEINREYDADLFAARCLLRSCGPDHYEFFDADIRDLMMLSHKYINMFAALREAEISQESFARLISTNMTRRNERNRLIRWLTKQGIIKEEPNE